MAKILQELQNTYDNVGSEVDSLIEGADAISGAPLRRLLGQAGLTASTSKPFKLLDTACGTGVVAKQLQTVISKEVLGKSEILCGDFTQRFVDIVKGRVENEEWVNTRVIVMDAQDSKLSDGEFTHVTISHALHIIPDPDAALKDIYRVLKPGGILALSTMHKDNQGWIPDLRAALASLPFQALPDPMPMTPNGRRAWADPDGVETELEKHGFEDVRVETIKHVQRIRSAEHYIQGFGMMLDWLVSTLWTREQRDSYQGGLKERVRKFLEVRYEGEGWDIEWTMVLAVCQK